MKSKPKAFLQKNLDKMRNRDIAILLSGMSASHTDCSLDTITLYILWLEAKFPDNKASQKEENNLGSFP